MHSYRLSARFLEQFLYLSLSHPTSSEHEIYMFWYLISVLTIISQNKKKYEMFLYKRIPDSFIYGEHIHYLMFPPDHFKLTLA